MERWLGGFNTEAQASTRRDVPAGTYQGTWKRCLIGRRGGNSRQRQCWNSKIGIAGWDAGVQASIKNLMQCKNATLIIQYPARRIRFQEASDYTFCCAAHTNDGSGRHSLLNATDTAVYKVLCQWPRPRCGLLISPHGLPHPPAAWFGSWVERFPAISTLAGLSGLKVSWPPGQVESNPGMSLGWTPRELCCCHRAGLSLDLVITSHLASCT